MLVVFALVAAGACGGDDDAESSANPGADATTTEAAEPDAAESDASESESTEADVDESAATGTRTVEHELGTSEVPVDPQRVVVVDRRGTLAFLLDLGVEPVGALEASWLFGQPFHPAIADQAEAAGVEAIDGTDGPDVEQIAALEPDLIIGMVRDMAGTEAILAETAPTIGLSWSFANPIDNVLMIGAMMGMEEEAEAVAGELSTALEEAAANATDAGTVSVLGLFGPDDIRVYRAGNLYGQLIQDLGGEVVPTEEELPLVDGEDVTYISLEQIGVADGEKVISLVNLSSEEEGAHLEVVEQPLVQALPAFQSGQVLETDPQLAFGAAGVTGLHLMLDQLAEFLGS
ncbi:MAG: ABC transporter substrate-binding protein [Actinomycetota bacterium]|nr:ABC transporter substrate-binding protein [Actinomycetota bacterium]